MLLAQNNALWRALTACANFLRKSYRKPRIKGAALPPMTPHHMRDIGLEPTQEALLRHRWPSQSARHPYL